MHAFIYILCHCIHIIHVIYPICIHVFMYFYVVNKLKLKLILHQMNNIIIPPHLISFNSFLHGIKAAETKQSVQSGSSPSKAQSSNEVDLEIAKMVQQKTVMASSPRKGTSEVPVVQEKTVMASSPSEVDLEIAKMVQQKTVMASSPRKGTSEEPVVLHIWDFAGHDLYYTTHQVCTKYKF